MNDVVADPATETAGPDSAARLRALEAEVAPLRARAAEIEAEVAKLDAEADPTSFPEALAARRVRAARKAEIEFERDLIFERLSPLDAQMAVLCEEAKIDALRDANAQFEADILEALAGIRPGAEEYLNNAEILRKQLDGARAKGLRQTLKVRAAIGELAQIVARANSLLSGGLR